jgi:hypothetical protein
MVRRRTNYRARLASKRRTGAARALHGSAGAISAAKLKRKVEVSIVDALVDHVDADGAVARTRADAPEIDGVRAHP